MPEAFKNIQKTQTMKANAKPPGTITSELSDMLSMTAFLSSLSGERGGIRLEGVWSESELYPEEIKTDKGGVGDP